MVPCHRSGVEPGDEDICRHRTGCQYRIGRGSDGGDSRMSCSRSAGRDRRKKFKAAQIGGPSGGCLPEELLDTPLDYDSLKKAGAMVGSGGLVILDEGTCMVEVARFFMHFTQRESCGKCVPCREGTKRMLEIMEKIVSGRATLEDLDTLEQIAWVVKESSLCALGKTAPNPVLTTLKYFRDEYGAHCRQEVSCRGVHRIQVLRYPPRTVQGLWQVPQDVSCRGDHRRDEASSCDRCREVPKVRCVCRGLFLRRYFAGVARNRGEREDTKCLCNRESS